MEAMLWCRLFIDFEFWFYSYFWGDFGIDCRMVLCRVFGMFYAIFVACFMASIGKIMWLVDKGCSGMVSGKKLACTGAAKELSGTSVRGGWPQFCNLQVRNCVGFHAIA